MCCRGHYPLLCTAPLSIAEHCSKGGIMHYNRNDDMMTYNNTSTPPLSFDWKWGHYPLLWIINYTLILKQNIRLNIILAQLTVLFYCGRAHVCASVCVDTGQALTNGADNETSPLIKRSHIELCTVVRHWTHTQTHKNPLTHTQKNMQ